MNDNILTEKDIEEFASVVNMIRIVVDNASDQIAMATIIGIAAMGTIETRADDNGYDIAPGELMEMLEGKNFKEAATLLIELFGERTKQENKFL